jgi:outer membrane lipoprotein-sorting protein
MKKIIIFTILILMVIILTGCGESFQRSVKTFKSEYTGGLERKIEVYSATGELLKTYEGKLDIETNESGNKVLFDMNGKRTIIYNATVIVEEK